MANVCLGGPSVDFLCRQFADLSIKIFAAVSPQVSLVWSYAHSAPPQYMHARMAMGNKETFQTAYRRGIWGTEIVSDPISFGV